MTVLNKIYHVVQNSGGEKFGEFGEMNVIC